MTEKRKTSQGYIIRILQHFATTLRNITNFVMVFQAVTKCPGLSRSKFHLKGERSIQDSETMSIFDLCTITEHYRSKIL